MFVPNKHQGNRRDTAILLTGTAEEHGIDQRSIRSTSLGFVVTDELAELIGLDVEKVEAEAPSDPPPPPVAEGEDDDTVPPYAEWEYNDLKSEVATRSLDTEDNKKDTLIAALVADDAAQSE